MMTGLASTPNPLLTRILGLARETSVLYVEDEPEIRQEMSEILTSLFPEVVTVSNGLEGLEALRKRDFLLVITDINMPEMTGIEMISEVRTFKPHQAILVTSAYSDASNLIPLLNLGIGSFLLKPLNWEQLLPTLYKELSLALSAQQEARYQKRLEREVELRTQELHESQQQVLKLGEAKDNMLSLISHEMRTPLNAVLGFLEQLRTTVEGNDEALLYVGYIEDASRRLDRSTRKSLEFIHFSTGKKTIRLKEFRLAEALEAAWTQVVRILNATPSEPYQWKGEAGQLLVSDFDLTVETFKNLFENGLKYGGDNPRLEVSLEVHSIWTDITFRDFGPGFTQAAMATLFSPFSSGNIMHHSEGMGMGLALVDVMMLTLGGKVVVGNHPDGGGVVTLSFPAARAEPSSRHLP